MKYSDELRMEVVREIEKGGTIKGTARKYGVDRNCAREWYRHYQMDGTAGCTRQKYQEYSAEFKLNAIEYMEVNDVSLSQTCTVFGIPHIATLWSWRKTYFEKGYEYLQNARKGRPLQMPKKSQKPQKDLTREEQLEAENQQLRMENAYLKKLNALVAEREKSAKKTK